jgi:lipoprotein-anchoring transpeptidase ErfK/SrfK
MQSASLARRVALVLVATALIMVSASLAWATANDYKSRGFVPTGVSVVGKDLSGMTEAEARAAVEGAVASPLLRPLTVTAADKTFVFDPKGIVTVDVEGMLAQAYAPRRNATLIARVQHDLAGAPLPAQIEAKYTVDQTAIASWLAGVQSQVDTKPVNAERQIKKYKLVVKPSVVGLKTDVVGAQAAIVQALSADTALSDSASRSTSIPVTAIKPKIVETSFKKTLVVSLSQRKVRLYDGAKLQKTYSIAIGQPAYPTPTGDWKIINKRMNPTWTNPGSGWAATMPAYIAPGYSNPLGTRALDLDASGIRFHGSSNDGSIGTAASHGCMRMHMSDVEELYPLVPVGTPVYIRP